jgi:hypothetical protein
MWYWLKWWLYDHEPVFCASCSRLMFRKNARRKQLLTGAWVKICPACDVKFFGE